MSGLHFPEQALHQGEFLALERDREGIGEHVEGRFREVDDDRVERGPRVGKEYHRELVGEDPVNRASLDDSRDPEQGGQGDEIGGGLYP